MSYRLWTKEEITYLEESWGNKSLKTISRNLNRSEKSILMKKRKLGLGAFLESGDYITLNQLMKNIGYDTYRSTSKSWIKNNIPIINKKVNNSSFKVVKIDEFWKWAEENKNLLNFSKFERYSLGKEPGWVEQKRQQDIINRENQRSHKPWTRDEDERLIFLVNEYKYDYVEIAKRMKRSESSIEHRLANLNIKARPIEEKTKSKRWTNEEIEKVKTLIQKGYDFEAIQSKFMPDKTIRSISTKMYRLYGTRELDKLRTIIDKQTCVISSSRKKWTDEERQLLEDMVWECWSYKDIQKALPGRSLEAIRAQVKINKYER